MSDSNTGQSSDGRIAQGDPLLPMIYVVTPTYSRPVQKAELTRMCHTFLLVPNLHWILVEDARAKTKLVEDHLKTCGVSYTHLFELTPADWKLQRGKQSLETKFISTMNRTLLFPYI